MKILIFGLPGSGKTTLAVPLAKLLNGVHLNSDQVREEYSDWDFSIEGRIRQAQRMRHLADGIVKSGKIAIADFICPTDQTRIEFDANYTVWMDTIKVSKYSDTNSIFQSPDSVDYHVARWFDDTHAQLMPVVQRWMEKNNV